MYDIQPPGPADDPNDPTPPALFLRPERVDVKPEREEGAPPPPGPPDELPKDEKPYSVSLGAGGARLAVGMEDGSLLLFAAGEEGWRLCWRQKRHAKEVRDACFSHDGSTLCTVAPDGQCLIWPLEESGQLAEGRPAAWTAP